MEIFEQYLFNGIYLLYTAAWIFYLLYAFLRNQKLSQIALALVAVAVGAHFCDFALRAYVGLALHGLKWYVPWSNWFESFSLFAFVIGVTFLAVQAIYRLPALGPFVIGLLWTLLTFSMSYPFFSWENFHSSGEFWTAVLSSRAIPQLMPALQSYWMAIHVPIMFISYSAFGVAFAVGIIYLIQERQIKSKHPTEIANLLPALEPLDTIIYRLIGWGFPLLTLGIILGARWAYDAWGRYWGWDAKETWALITWLTYAIYLHMRLVLSWRGRKTVILSVLAFGVVLFTYVGVNYLSQLHGFLSNRGA